MATLKLEIKRWLPGNWKLKDGYLEIRNRKMFAWKLEIKNGYLEIINKKMATWKLEIKLWLPRNYK